MLGGVLRLQTMLPGVAETSESHRFHAAPLPILLHIVAVTIYSLLGAFQFSGGVRKRWPLWHRRAGLLLTFSGLMTAMTGLWMTLFYPIPPEMQGPILYWVRIAVGLGMTLSLVLAWTRILKRDVAAHEAWMVRAYALAQGAGMQAVIMGPVFAIYGPLLGITRDILMSLAWAINLGVAESILSRRKLKVSQKGFVLAQKKFKGEAVSFLG
jgi:hypothetical protein